MKEQRPALGQAQLEILRYVADHHPISVGEVADYVARTSGKARTTVLTVMERLRSKGYLVRKKIEGTYHYSPRVPRVEVLRNLVGDFVQGVLGGSVSPFMAYLAESESLTDDEIVQLKQLARQIESRHKKLKDGKFQDGDSGNA